MEHSTEIRGLVLAALFLVPAATAAAEGAADAAADETIEEIVVTGTRVRRSSFDSASPLSIITADDLDSLGISGLSDLTATLPFTLGNITNSSLIATALGGGNCCVDLADNPVNLRGLGSEGTLQLINGKRTLIKNINLLAPMIAIDRLEVLKDGASALYGSEAVGGVVNLMTVREFDGLELWLSADMTTEDPKGAFNPNRQRDQMWQNAAEVMWGRTGDRTSFVAALSYFERDPLHNADRPELTGRAFGTSGSGQPGTFSVPEPAAPRTRRLAAGPVGDGAFADRPGVREPELCWIRRSRNVPVERVGYPHVGLLPLRLQPAPRDLR